MIVCFPSPDLIVNGTRIAWEARTCVFPNRRRQPADVPQRLTSGLLIEWPTENGPNREIRASQDSNDATEEAMRHG